MDVPNLSDSDIDITISVKNSKEQEEVGKELLFIGYKLTNIYDENEGSNMKWHSYHNYINNIEIEIKVRDKIIVKRVLIAHKGIMNDLTPLQKLKVSYIKSILSQGDVRTYKNFKYILYGAMFNGNNTIIFRRYN